jgi:hypothetical protein
MNARLRKALERKKDIGKRFNLGAPSVGEPLHPEVVTSLDVQSAKYDAVVKRGVTMRRFEERRFGGSALPHENGGIQFFKRKG